MKRCPACQRSYDDTMTFCLEDGSALAGDASAASDMAATVIMPDPRVTAPPAQPETYRPGPSPAHQPQSYAPPQPYSQPAPSWPPTHQPPPSYQATTARPGRSAAVTALVLAITAFVLLAFCIIGGATNVNTDLIGGLFIFSVLLALTGAVIGIVATSKSGKDQSAQNARTLAIVALVLNGLYLLLTVVFLILGAIAQSSS